MGSKMNATLAVLESDKVTCTRCNGKGFGSWREQHGVCFKCWGVGYNLTGESKRLADIAEVTRGINQLEQELADTETAVAKMRPKMAEKFIVRIEQIKKSLDEQKLKLGSLQ